MNRSKWLLGFLSCLFLNVFGLLIGIVLFKDRARRTFVKGWVSCIVFAIILTVAAFCLIIFGGSLLMKLYEATNSPFVLELLRLANQIRIG